MSNIATHKSSLSGRDSYDPACKKILETKGRIWMINKDMTNKR